MSDQERQTMQELVHACQAALAYLVDQPSVFKENRDHAATLIRNAKRSGQSLLNAHDDAKATGKPV